MKCSNVKCDKEHDGSYGSGKFCSRSCANSRTRSDETKIKISNSIKKAHTEGRAKMPILAPEQVLEVIQKKKDTWKKKLLEQLLK